MQITLDDSLTDLLKRKAHENNISLDAFVNRILSTAIKQEKEKKDNQAMRDFIDFLQPRIERARRGETVNTTVEDIFKEVRKEVAAL